MRSSYLLIYDVSVEILDTRGHFMVAGNISESLNEKSSMPKPIIFSRYYKVYDYFNNYYPTMLKLIPSSSRAKIGLHIHENQYISE